jgi:8-oxo-dGTP pyrophosphatase MutT (NUDIX family)
MNPQENPWQTLTSTVVYENPWVSVRHEEVITPAGTPGIYGVAHFKHKAIAVVPIDEQGNTWLVGQYRYPLKEYSWEIPMGGGKMDVDILESARRELQEETGLTAARWKLIGRMHTSNSVTDEEGFLFIAEELTAGPTQFDDTEIIQIRKLPLTEAVQMVMDSQITDSLSVYGLLKVARLRGI